MQPIVNGIQDEYNDSVTFVSLNAQDSEDGEATFQSLGLPGHPSIVIYTPDGTEVYRRFGIVTFDELDTTLVGTLEN